MDVCFHVSATMLILGKEHGPTSVGREKKKKSQGRKEERSGKIGREDGCNQQIHFHRF